MSDETTRAFAHCVYFTLKEKTAEAQEQFLAACQEFLTDHPGTLYFGVGPRATEYQRPVNDLTFDIALVVVFASEADHDRYQVSDRHQEFIAAGSKLWSEVRVFDAFV